MLNHEETERQIRGWVIAAAITPLAHASGCGWFVTALATITFLPLSMIWMNGWKNIGRFLCVLEFLWLIPVLAYLGKSCGAYWPAKNELAVPITILILSAVSTQVDKEAKVGAVILCSMVLLSVPMLLSGISEIQTPWLRPDASTWSWELTAGLLIPGLSGLWNTAGRRNTGMAAAVAIFALAAATITQGVLSPAICNQESAPLYTLAQTLRLGGLSRFEPLVSVAITFGFYAACSFLICCAGTFGERLGMKRATASIIVTLIAIGVMLLRVPENDVVLTAGCVIGWFLVPIIGLKKRSKKNEKSA